MVAAFFFYHNENKTAGAKSFRLIIPLEALTLQEASLQDTECAYLASFMACRPT